MSITGTPADDVITVFPDRSERQLLDVSINSHVSRFTAGRVASIRVNALSGNDEIYLDPTIQIPATLLGGTGNDTLTGGSGVDSLDGGSGIDQFDLVSGAGVSPASLPQTVRSALTKMAGNYTLGHVTRFSENGRNYFGTLVHMNVEVRMVVDAWGYVVTDGAADKNGGEGDHTAHRFGIVTAVNPTLHTVTVKVGSLSGFSREVTYGARGSTVTMQPPCGCKAETTPETLSNVNVGSVIKVNVGVAEPLKAIALAMISPAGGVGSACGGFIYSFIGSSSSSLYSASSWNPSGVPGQYDGVTFSNTVSLSAFSGIHYCSMTVRKTVTFDMGGSTFTLNNGYTASTSASSLVLINASAATIVGTQTWANGGKLTINGVAGQPPAMVSIGNDFGFDGAYPATPSFSDVQVSSLDSQHVKNLILTNGATFTVPVSSSSGPFIFRSDAGLSIDSTSSLDINNGTAVLDSNASTPSISTLMSDLQTGYALGNWNGPGIRTSAAHSIEGIGIMVNNGAYSDWNGQAIGADDILLRYTYMGDANLDGRVDGSDYTKIDSGFTARATGWSNGDFNYDGVVDGSDYALIDNAFNNQGPVLTDFTPAGT